MEHFPPELPFLAVLIPPQMAFFEFTRAFGQVFGIAIGGTILQNQLYAKLPAAFTEQLGPDLYAAIPLIRTL